MQGKRTTIYSLPLEDWLSFACVCVVFVKSIVVRGSVCFVSVDFLFVIGFLKLFFLLSKLLAVDSLRFTICTLALCVLEDWICFSFSL